MAKASKITISEVDDLKAKLTAAPKKEPPPAWRRGLSTGCTLLNLACSGRADVGLLPGGYYFFVGDSASGKTWISLACLAEAALSPAYKDYRLIHDDVEGGAHMDIGRFFGPLAGRRLPPAGTAQEPAYSSTLEEFYYNLDAAMDKGPCVYVLDSMDALTCRDDEEKFAEGRKAHEKGKEVSGSYGLGKAKLNSAYLRVANNRLRKTGSILIILAQTRENIGYGAQFNPKTRGGGKALSFYAQLELWTSVKGHIKKTVRDKEREQGIYAHIKVSKNRYTARVGKDCAVTLPIYNSHGVDEVGACVDWLVEEGFFGKDGARLKAPQLDLAGFREDVIRKIEEAGREGELRRLMQQCWDEIEEATRVRRKHRYGGGDNDGRAEKEE